MPLARVEPQTAEVEAALTPELRQAYRDRARASLERIWPDAEGDIEVTFLHAPLDADPAGPDIIVWLLTTNQGRRPKLAVAMDTLMRDCRLAGMFAFCRRIDVSGEAPGGDRLWEQYADTIRRWPHPPQW